LAGFARHRLKFLTLTFVPVFAKQIEQMLTVMRSKQANNKDLCRYVIRSTCFPPAHPGIDLSLWCQAELTVVVYFLRRRYFSSGSKSLENSQISLKAFSKILQSVKNMVSANRGVNGGASL